ncbi:MAG: sulfate reduction electron transfer complex DsrMKJOP subunit DsrJ [Planctomycetota bacterium]
MYDRGIILTGLGAFLVVVLLPFWWGAAAGQPGADPPDLPAATAQPCVMEPAYMRAAHMDLLNRWRDEVVRNDARFFTAADGYGLESGRERDEKSLSLTCLRCHDKEQFCDRCHDYSGIAPTCWKCHVVPPGGE